MTWKSPAPVRAAIFDLDGTLVDSMELHYESYRRVFSESGIELTRNQYFGNIGGKAQETIPKFLAGRECAMSVDQIHRRKLVTFERVLSESAPRELDTARVLEALAEQIPVALASSASRPGIDVILAKFRWGGIFDVIVAGDDVEHGKPAPDIFLRAATALGIAPAHCLVFEDTEDGVEGAHAAGMSVVDVRRMCGTGASSR